MTSAGLKICTQCGHMNPPNARFCNQCGKGIGTERAPERYTPRHLSEKILQMRSSLEGERKQVTVLFVDVKGSVALSQQVEAEQWHGIMDRFFALLTDNIHRFEGTINQYTGDGIMALFGAPIAHEDHAHRACRAALSIQADMVALAEELARLHGMNFSIRQGLNSGEVIVGRIGDDLRMDYTAKGQTVGLAARMEQLARPDTILISGLTRDLVAGAFGVSERAGLSVKGFENKIRTYELTGLKKELPPELEDVIPMVGRESELSLLSAYREQVVQQGGGLLVSISAGTGLGKSRLCREFMARCRQQSVRVVGVSGSSHHRAEPLAPIRELFLSYLQLHGAEDAAAVRARVMEIGKSYPGVPPVLIGNLLRLLGADEDAVDAPADTGRCAELAMALVQHLLRDGALNQHLVCVIENVHWLDDAQTGPVFDDLIARLAHVPVLVVMTARSDYRYRWRDHRRVRHLDLQPLSESQAEQFLVHLLGADKSLAALRHAIAQRADGNPMFISEVVQQLVSTRVLEREGRGYKLRRQPGEIRLPPSVQAVVAARIDALAEDTKRLLQTAAVIGRRIPLALLRSLHPSNAFDQELQELLQQGFLQLEPGPEKRAALLFSQSLFQTVAYEALLLDVRREIHRKVAVALRPEHSQDPTQLAQAARHFAAAGESAAAVRWYLASAERAAETDLPEALRRLDRARGLLGESGAEDGVPTMRVLARWLQFAARLEVDRHQVEDVLAQARSLLDRDLGLPDQILFAVTQGSVALARSKPDQALEHFLQAQNLLLPQCAVELKLLVAVPLVYGLQANGQLEEALRHCDQALAWCTKDDAPGRDLLSYSPCVALTTLKAWVSSWLGDVAQALGLGQEALVAAESSRHGEQRVAALAVLAFIEAEAGQTDLAQAHAQQALDIAAGTRNGVSELLALAALGRAQVRGGCWAEAVASLEDALARTEGRAFGLGECARMEADLSLAHLAAGNARQARISAAQAVKRAEQSGSALAEIEASLAQIRAGLFSSRPQSFLKRYQASLAELEERMADRHVRLLEPELLLLKARCCELRRENENVRQLRGQAAARAEQFGVPLPLCSKF